MSGMNVVDRAEYGDHCAFCGEKFADDAASRARVDWPRKCSKGHWMYNTPDTVAVALLPLVSPNSFDLVGVRRNIEPKLGEIALPGGFNNGRSKKQPKGETWQEATVRELNEESKGLIDVPASEVQEWLVRSTGNHTLVFGLLQPRPRAWFLDVQQKFKETPSKPGEVEETQELVLIMGPETELAFPFHTEAANRYFKSADLTLAQMRALRA